MASSLAARARSVRSCPCFSPSTPRVIAAQVMVLWSWQAARVSAGLRGLGPAAHLLPGEACTGLSETSPAVSDILSMSGSQDRGPGTRTGGFLDTAPGGRLWGLQYEADLVSGHGQTGARPDLCWATQPVRDRERGPGVRWAIRLHPPSGMPLIRMAPASEQTPLSGESQSGVLVASLICSDSEAKDRTRLKLRSFCFRTGLRCRISSKLRLMLCRLGLSSRVS